MKQMADVMTTAGLLANLIGTLTAQKYSVVYKLQTFRNLSVLPNILWVLCLTSRAHCDHCWKAALKKIF